MYQWQPSKWLQMAVVGAGLPFLTAGLLQTNGLIQDVSSRALAAAGGLKVEMDGRDAKISGTVPSKDTQDAVIKSVMRTYGVRTINADGLKVVEPVALAAPTIDSQTSKDAMPLITGTWPEGAAKTLSVTAGGKTYELGKSPELSSSSGKWALKLAEALPAGSNDVTAQVGDGAKAATSAAEPGKIIVEAAAQPPKVEAKPLAKPTVTAIITNNTTPEIKGTYPPEAAKLSVGLGDKTGDKTFVLGKDAELTADKSGNWSLKPTTALPDGEVKVTAKVEDASGKATASSDAASIVIDTKPPAAPSVTPAPADAIWPYAITGKWDETPGSKLAVDLNKKSYALGKDKELISDGHGAFTFVPSDTLAPGKYSLDFTASDAAGNTTKFTAKDAIVIAAATAAPAAAPAMAAPTVDSVTSDSDHPTVKGTWPAGIATSLTVELDGVKHKLGHDFDLLSDAAGHWTLKPKAPVVNGTYDVIVSVTDAAGKTVTDAGKGELTVKVAAPPPAPPASQAYDCQGTLARIAAVFPVRFDYDKFDLHAPFDMAVNQYAALLKDARCASIKLQVAGHADDRGTEAYNQSLSEHRAKAVIEALTKAGVDTARLTGLGFGKDKPLDPSHSEDARRKNRRAEFTVAK